jgi:CHASE3 domain sensor protein
MKEILAFLGLKKNGTIAEAIAAIQSLFDKIKALESQDALKTITEERDKANDKVAELEESLAAQQEVGAEASAKIIELENQLRNAAIQKQVGITENEAKKIAEDFKASNPDVKELSVCADGEIYIISEMAKKHASVIGITQIFPFSFTE